MMIGWMTGEGKQGRQNGEREKRRVDKMKGRDSWKAKKSG